MKNTQPVLLLTAVALLGAAAAGHAENAMYSCTRADGSTTLTNVPVGSHCEQLFAYKPPVEASPAPAPAPAAAPAPVLQARAPAQSVAATAGVEQQARPAADPAANAASARTALAQRMSQRRDEARLAVADAYARGQPASVANPATSRRYLMTNRAQYMQANGFTP